VIRDYVDIGILEVSSVRSLPNASFFMVFISIPTALAATKIPIHQKQALLVTTKCIRFFVHLYCNY